MIDHEQPPVTGHPTGTQPRTAGRTDRRRARTRGALVDATVALLRDGHRDLSIRQITEAADVGFGSFYNHFASKDEIFHAAFNQVIAPWARRLAPLVDAEPDPARRFAMGARILMRLHTAPGSVTGPLIVATQTLPEVEDGALGNLTELVRQGVAAGRFRPMDANLAVLAIAGAVRAFLSQAPSLRVGSVAALIDELTAAMLRLLGVDADQADALATEADLPVLGDTDDR